MKFVCYLIRSTFMNRLYFYKNFLIWIIHIFNLFMFFPRDLTSFDDFAGLGETVFGDLTSFDDFAGLGETFFDDFAGLGETVFDDLTSFDDFAGLGETFFGDLTSFDDFAGLGETSFNDFAGLGGSFFDNFAGPSKTSFDDFAVFSQSSNIYRKAINFLFIFSFFKISCTLLIIFSSEFFSIS